MESKPKIMIPAMPLDGGASGIGMYIVNLVKYLSEMNDFETVILGLKHEKNFLQIGRNGSFIEVDSIYSSTLKNIFWHEFWLLKLASKHNINLVWLPAGNRRMVKSSSKTPAICATIHDLAHFRMPQKYGMLRNFYVKKLLPIAWKNSSSLISVSEKTKEDLLKYTNIDAALVSVVPNGYDQELFFQRNKKDVKKILSEYKLPSKYILYVARIEHPGKGHALLLKAFRHLLDKNKNLEHKLVFAGKDWNQADEVRHLVSELGLSEHVIMLGFVNGEDLPFLYNGADLVAFPSLYEGFGIPLLEAMGCGVPVISSNRGALPEVAGSALKLFDPENIEDSTLALETGLFDSEYRDKSVKLGQKRAQDFSWISCAEKTADVFRRKLFA